MVKILSKLSIGIISGLLFLVLFSFVKAERVEASCDPLANWVACLNVRIHDGSDTGPLIAASVTLNVGPLKGAAYYCDSPGRYDFTETKTSPFAIWGDICCASAVTQIRFKVDMAGYYPIPWSVISGDLSNGNGYTWDLYLVKIPTNTLNVRSSGASSVAITGTYPGTTNYTRSSTSNYSGTLTAPSTSGSNTFSSWSGCTSTSGTNCTVSVSGGGTQTVTANYTAVTNNTLNVRSSPITGISITGTYPGSTNYTKTDSATLSGTLTAPSTSGSYTFSSWSGCDSSSGRNCTVAVSGGSSQTVTANYTAPAGTNTLNVNSNPISGVSITGTYSGSTPYSATSASAMSGTLTAPATSGSYTFSSWSGCTSTSGTNCTVSVSSGGTQTVTANYTAPGALGTPTLTAITGLPCVTSGLTYGPAVAFAWSNVAGAASYDAQVSIYNRQFPDAATGDFVNAGNGGYFVYKYSNVPTNTTGASGWNSAGGMPINALNQPLRLNPGTTYYWHVRAKNSTSSGSWSSVGSFSAATCPAAPDLQIATGSLVTSIVSPVVGDSVTFSGKVINSGSTTATSSSARFCLDDTLANCYAAITKRIGAADSAVPSLKAGVTSGFINSSGTWSPTAADVSTNPHWFIMCADSGKVITESNENNNCLQSANINVSAPPPVPTDWVRTENGNVGSVGEIDLDNFGHNSSASNSNVEYIRQTTAIAVGTYFLSFKNWLVNIDPNPQGPKDYDSLYKELKGSSGCDLGGGITNIPDKDGKFKVTGDLRVNGGYSAACPTLPSSNKGAVVFVSGDLQIDDNTNPLSKHIIGYGSTRPTIFIVKGDIKIDKKDTEINAVLVNDKSFNDYLGATNTLTVYGSIISALDVAGTSTVTLGRRTGTAVESEHIILQPSYFYYLSDYAGVATTTFREEKP